MKAEKLAKMGKRGKTAIPLAPTFNLGLAPVEVAEAPLGGFAFFWGGLLVEILLRGAVARCPGTLRAGRPGALRAAYPLRNTLTGRTHGARGSPREWRRRRPRWGGVIRPGPGNLGAARRQGVRTTRSRRARAQRRNPRLHYEVPFGFTRAVVLPLLGKQRRTRWARSRAQFCHDVLRGSTTFCAHREFFGAFWRSALGSKNSTLVCISGICSIDRAI